MDICTSMCMCIHDVYILCVCICLSVSLCVYILVCKPLYLCLGASIFTLHALMSIHLFTHLFACVCLCDHLHVYGGMSVCLHKSVCMRINFFRWLWVNESVCPCADVYVVEYMGGLLMHENFVCLGVYVCLCLYVCACLCAMHAHLCFHAYIWLYIQVSMHVCVREGVLVSANVGAHISMSACTG